MAGLRESKPTPTRLFRAASLGPAFVAAFLFAWAAPSQAADCTAPLAQVVLVKGSVELVRQGTQRLVVAESNAGLCAGDTVVVHQNGQAALLLANATVVRLDQGTTVTISPSISGRPALLNVISGAIYVISRTPQPFRVRTPFINANVEGTEFLVEVRRGQGDAEAIGCLGPLTQPAETDRVTVYEGSVRVDARSGSLLVAAGETAMATATQGPIKDLTVRPKDAVTWTLYVPTILRAEGRATKALGCATQLLAQGLLAPAKSELNRMLAATGAAEDAVVYALLATIAVAENERIEAIAASDRAVGLDAQSAPAWLARSYAQQARFRIEDALASAERAVDLEPANALALARRAELQMSVGRLEAALASAQRAVQLDPQISRTQTVLGFANLTRTEIKAARTSFERAIALDSTDPLPRLGLGLARIRAGELAAGRVDVEVAAILDPNQSLVRSYLGKAYFDERRDKLAQGQFSLAKELDPNDPTPWFYDAVRGQTSNEPGLALKDMQLSIEKNANRAVFRSKLLLDDDLAARSISQASIYRQLGFEQLALFEAYKALAADPLGFSAHRFLAEAYVERPRHQFARENEALQAQMLQPISLYPLQLPLTATEAGAFGTSVLFDPGFSEYNRLYVRNGLNGQALGLVGGRGTRADQLLVTGVSDALSYSAGQFHYETDGFRSNAQSRKDLYDVFLQFTPNEDASIHLEWRRVRLAEGDLSLRFDPEFTTDFRYGQRKEAHPAGRTPAPRRAHHASLVPGNPGVA